MDLNLDHSTNPHVEAGFGLYYMVVNCIVQKAVHSTGIANTVVPS